MSRYLDPKADVVFKKIFADHPRLLISFLNAVLPLDKEIVTIEYLPVEQIPQIPTFKRTIADVKCTDQTERVFIVEMQMEWTDSFRQRLLYGTSHAIVKQLEKGNPYTLLQPVYGLGIIADIFDRKSPDWYHHYSLIKNGSFTQEVIEHLQLIFIELPKFPIETPETKRLRLLWLRFLREIGEKTTKVSQDLLDIPEICEAVQLSEEAGYSPSELESYNSYWDAVRTEKTLMIDKYKEGKAEGLVEGEAKGIEKGKAEGKAEEQLAIAKRLLNDGIDLNIIANCTGLTIDQIKSI